MDPLRGWTADKPPGRPHHPSLGFRIHRFEAKIRILPELCVNSLQNMLAPSTKHYHVEINGDSLKLVIPYRTQWFKTIVYGLFLIAVMIVLTQFWENTYLPFHNLFAFSELTLVLIVSSLVSIALILIELLWQVLGKEVIEINKDHIVLRHQILGIGYTRKHLATRIPCVFGSQQKDDWIVELSLREFSFTNFKRGKIAFNDGKYLLGGVRTFRFGSSLDSEETKQIINLIHEQYPQYRDKK